MYMPSNQPQSTFDWQSPEFLKTFDRSLLPANPRRPSAKPAKKEKERLYKQVTRRTAR